jgi:hypothetical protein
LRGCCHVNCLKAKNGFCAALFERAATSDKLIDRASAAERAMPEEVQSRTKIPRRVRFWQVPLFRLLLINLATGTALAALLVGGLLVLNPFGLRDLILADREPGTALGLLLFGFVVTFGSTAMGTAIMAAGQWQADDEGPRGPPRLLAQPLSKSRARAGRQR